MANQLTNYLANFKAEKNGNITHTRIGDKNLNIYGGSYNIPDESHLEFMEIYYNWVVVAGNDEYLTEKQDRTEGVIALDFDFRYDTSIKTRQHDDDHIIDALMLYMDKLNELCDIPIDTTITAYVMHKPNPNCLENKTKDGIHIIIDAKLNRNAQKIMRLMLVSNLKDVWADLPITNGWDDIVDEGVVNASVNWQLYGSHKPNNETYKLTHKYEFKLQNDGFEPNMLKIDDALSFDDFLKLSVQSGGEYVLQIKEEHKEGIEKHFQKTHDKQNGLLTPPPEQNNNKNVKNDEYLDLLFNVIGNGYFNGVKCVSYHQRLTIRFVLKSNGYDKQHYIDYCNLREGKGMDNAEDDWEKLSIKEVSPLGLLEGLAKKINASEYKKWSKTREDKIKEIGKKMLIESIKQSESEDEKSYQKVKEEFEKNHSLIVNKSLYIKETDDDVIFMKESQLITSYKSLKYSEPQIKKNNIKLVDDNCFIKRWIFDEKIRKYETIAVYPPPLKCPSNVFNLWKPFSISKYTDEYVKDEEGLDMFKNHIKILCGNDENVKDYLIKWIGQMFQYPAVKTNVPTFISGEGAGKGSLLELLSNMMGTGKVLVTTQPSRDVWGSFNGLMSNCFLVNLNEMSKKETADAEGKIKGLITDTQLTINKKGIDPYLINSYNRFMGTTNSEDPVKTKKGDRRNMIIRSSDEKCGDKQYFKELIAKFKDINVMRTIYDYLMSIEDLDKFGELSVPETEYQNDMKEQYRDNYDRWIESYITQYQNEDVEYLKLGGENQYKLFQEWCEKNGIKYETSSIKMGLAIKRLKIDGIITGFRTNKGNETHYHIEKLKKHYKIGCMIEL
jgi:sporulation protein YlmC with PRC-barrel domain